MPNSILNEELMIALQPLRMAVIVRHDRTAVVVEKTRSDEALFAAQ